MTILELLKFVENIDKNILKDIHIVNDTVVCFYKTIFVKYTNKNNEKISYLFPTTFRYSNNKIHTSMVFGSVERSFQLPNGINGVGYGTELKLYSVNNHLYSLFVGENILDTTTEYFHFNIKSYMGIIEHLDKMGFPFMRITNNDALLPNI